MVSSDPAEVSVRPRGASVALAGLTHPACLAAMLVLGINDHVLKQAMPGWLTGKLSDFAGVFFFPFLIGALVGLGLPRVRDRWLRDIAVGLTGVWFALAKCTEVGWAGTVTVAESVVGPVSIVRDPTDVLALVMLVPAWRLWRELGRRPRPRRVALAGAPALVCAGLLSLATSRMEPPGVYALHVEGEWIQAKDTRDHYRSRDGLTWEQFTPDEEVVRQPGPWEVDWLGIHFVGSDGRIHGKDGVVEWEIPEGRRRYLRYRSDHVSFGPHALVVHGDGLVVALGTEGALHRDPDGTWTRVAVGLARPHPLVATRVSELWTWGSFVTAFVIGIFAVAPVVMLLWILIGADAEGRAYALAAAATGLIAVVLGGSGVPMLVLGALGGYLVTFLLVLFGWNRMSPANREELTPKLAVSLGGYVAVHLLAEAGYALGWLPDWYMVPLSASVAVAVWLVLAFRTVRPDREDGPPSAPASA